MVSIFFFSLLFCSINFILFKVNFIDQILCVLVFFLFISLLYIRVCFHLFFFIFFILFKYYLVFCPLLAYFLLHTPKKCTITTKQSNWPRRWSIACNCFSRSNILLVFFFHHHFVIVFIYFSLKLIFFTLNYCGFLPWFLLLVCFIIFSSSIFNLLKYAFKITIFDKKN